MPAFVLANLIITNPGIYMKYEAGFQNARAAAAADLQARQGLGQYQQALGQQGRQLDQAKLAADQEAAREAAFADYTQLGLITLIGLISKHGILLVEFANQLQNNGYSKKNHSQFPTP